MNAEQERFRQALRRIVRRINRAQEKIRRLSGRAFRMGFHRTGVLCDHPDWWPHHDHWPDRPMEAMQTTLDLRPIIRWRTWIPEAWGVCDVHVNHTPAQRLLKSWCVLIRAETPSW